MKLQANTTFRNSMANCCKNNRIICEPIIGCCTEFWIEVPPDYIEAVITIVITKANGASFQKSIVVEDGLVQIPLDEIPAEFFNSYGGPYTLEYIDPATGDVIGFTYQGQYVTGVQWKMKPGTSDNTICTLDVFQ